MASPALQEDLKCSICINIYSEPTTLPCGHTFCMRCIQKTIQTGVYLSCPECRCQLPIGNKFSRNTKMCSMVEHLKATKAMPGEHNKKCCSYCHSVAEKQCLDCETLLCNVHLENHKNPLHIFSDLNTPLQSRKCLVHRELLKYYCTEDNIAICSSCLIGDHRLHNVRKLSDLCEQKRFSLKKVEDLLTNKKSKTKEQIALAKNHKKDIDAKTECFRHLVTSMIGDIKKELEALEHQILGEIKSQKEKIIEQVSQVIKLLEDQLLELGTQIKEIQDLYKSSDPLTILQRGPSNNDKAKALLSVEDNLPVGGIDTELILVSLYSGIRRFTRNLPSLLQKRGFHIKDATAGLFPPFLILKLDGQNANDPQSAFSSFCLSSGQHYWEMETSDKPCWAIGVSYSKQNNIALEYDADSWYLALTKDKQYKAVQNGQEMVVMTDSPVQALAVYLEYETGKLSFYQLGSSMRQLYTMHCQFTQPLYIVMHVVHEGWIRITR